MDYLKVTGMGEIREAVRRHYAEAAKNASCCGDDCGCSTTLPAGAADLNLDRPLSLGSGRPVELAKLRPGESVLDLGSGAGIEVLVSARAVGANGRAYGVDMTDEMLALAESNRASAGVENASFLKGTIENVPLPDASVDVVISNCVINLSEDKGAVLREAFRVLRAGGRLAVADPVALSALPSKEDLDSWAACIAGALDVETYKSLLSQAGFEEISIDTNGAESTIANAHITARKPN